MMKHFPNSTQTKRLVTDALLSTFALIIFIIELQLPSLTPIPGIKLGLSNIVTLVTMFVLGPSDAFAVLMVRILLGGLLSGQLVALAYSLSGGLLSYAFMLLLRKIINDSQIFVCSILCAMAHNLGQIIIAVILTRTTAIIFYLPILFISGIITGLFTGLCAQLITPRLKKIIKIM